MDDTINRLDDTISRRSAIDSISCDIVVTGRQNAEIVVSTIGTFIDRLMALPSAQPERKRGRWKLQKNGNAICSECGFVQVSAWDADGWDNFCHHCGADMRGEEQDG